MEVDYIECGDCLKLMKELPDKSIDVVFTSPPYNRKRNDTYEYYDDTLSDYGNFLKQVTEECLRITKDKVIINVQQNYYNKQDLFQFMGRYYNKISGIIIWVKTNPQPSANYDEKTDTRSITNAYEYFIFLNDKAEKFRAYGKEQTLNYISSSVNSKSVNGHGAIMKKEVCDWFIKKFTKENDIVLDPFLGTGTTAVSCIEQGRHYIGFELSEEYFDIASNRLDEAESVI